MRGAIPTCQISPILAGLMNYRSPKGVYIESARTITALAFIVVLFAGWGFVVLLNILLGIRDNQEDFVERISKTETKIGIQEKRTDAIVKELLEV